ncbi:hypothetical protein ACGFNU_32775 [Spirillospora sp. NPDC048911]|uniref:hypothetical protein n=1 Tax=Spirillospora sp. NPDC048911 TaxID=3364527 RepID=UPI0037116913
MRTKDLPRFAPATPAKDGPAARRTALNEHNQALRTRAEDADGNTVDQTAIHAYGTVR